MKLTNQSKKYLTSIGYREQDFSQIEKAVTKMEIAIFEKNNTEQCKILTQKEAIDLIGTENYLSALARATFHSSASCEVPGTMGKYIVLISEEKNNNKELAANVKDIIAFQHFPHIYTTNIEWDIDEEDITEEIVDKQLVKEATGKTEEEIILQAREHDKSSTSEDIVYDYVLDAVHHNRISDEIMSRIDAPADTMEIPLNIWAELSPDDYSEAISDYISDESGYCHEGFCVECNLSVEEMYQLKEKLDEELTAEYKEYGETDITAAMEVELEEIETAICLMEAEIH